MSMIEVTGLGMRFGGVVALDSVSFAIGTNQHCCVIGPNGAGKSTFFKCLTGQLKPSDGDVRFKGRSIRGLHPHQIAKMGIGIKTQVPNVFDGLTAAENIQIALRRVCSGARLSSRLDEILETMHVAEIRNKMVGKLAHGHRQLVELGMVVAQDPDLILLDEPAAGMTKAESTRLAGLIKELAKKHAVIVVEHDMHFVRLIGGRVTVFNRGEVLMDDHVDLVLSDQRVKNVYLGKQAA
ncbi:MULTISPECIES: ATP-binding cassette domain-containing protein [unclassified Mesorhizobium]|uniref:ATP-binding cassette domain-containing protein n=1 Tax=unclassified Mesorhizobium TaxID=325217 RepID=UPI00112C2895|nr:MULTISPECIES: ATP-binding cassette domain-containing protein [unclassified Mesorhizobium]MBZ9811002.1 ATP-binding cassette domain-containing protein [Mesorhizobium sp. ESP-6-2]TPM27779.1 ATP-binding cassette domain-containing protein [Mesorhizobium sp. B2-2-2]